MIHKSHSKNDLIDLINTIDIPVVFSHQNNKKDIQEKLDVYLKTDIDKTLDPNVYKINSKRELILYLKNPNPKKSLNVKEKNTVMQICKKLITYCKNGYVLKKSLYKHEKEIEDDMDFIKQFGDIPSVRRVCKLMNQNIMDKKHYKPLISPQVQKELEAKMIHKKRYITCLEIKKGPIVLTFD
jgi:hypothetical protein